MKEYTITIQHPILIGISDARLKAELNEAMDKMFQHLTETQYKWTDLGNIKIIVNARRRQLQVHVMYSTSEPISERVIIVYSINPLLSLISIYYFFTRPRASLLHPWCVYTQNIYKHTHTSTKTHIPTQKVTPALCGAVPKELPASKGGENNQEVQNEHTKTTIV